MQQESKYGFTVGEEVICNGKADFVVGFIDNLNDEEYKAIIDPAKGQIYHYSES